MAKHPVPKKKTSKTRTRRRYSAFKSKAVKKLEGAVKANKHRYAKADSVLKDDKQKKEVEKITKVKA